MKKSFLNFDVVLYLVREKLADSNPVIIPYKVMNRMFTTIYGIIARSLFIVHLIFASEVYMTLVSSH